MKQLLTLLAFLVSSNTIAAPVYNVRDFGAKGDGKTKVKSYFGASQVQPIPAA